MLFILPTGMAQQGYYQFPIRPGKQNFLSGSMGEIRGDHFHSGIDIDTDEATGLPVYAAADGYISRIRINEGGYGHALYMKHPNGHTTVYGHLSRFDKRIETFIRQKQYANKSFTIDFSPSKTQFVYRKGQQIAFSGNSGGSEGPHLHFEIRNKEGHALNPLDFGFTEVLDTLPPFIEGVAIKTFAPDARVMGKFGRTEFSNFTRQGSRYGLAQSEPLDATGLLALEIRAFDESNGIDSRNGVNKLTVEVDGKTIYHFEVDKVVFSKGRYINLHIDYAAKAEERGNFQRCYVEDNNYLNLYRTNEMRGKFRIDDTELHRVSLKLYDSRGNLSQLEFQVQHKPDAGQQYTFRGTEFERFGNFLLFNVPASGRSSNVYIGGQAQELSPAYRVAGQEVFRWDLRIGLPDSILYPDGEAAYRVQPYHFQPMMAPGAEATRATPTIKVNFPKGSLYDTLYLQMYDWNRVFHIGDPTTPLLKSCYVALTPGYAVADKPRTKVYRIDEEGGYEYEGGTWSDSTIRFSTRDLGRFVLLTDEIPPVIRLETKNSREIHLTVGDNLSGIGSYRATLNDKWVLARFDPKEDHLWIEPLNESTPLRGKLVVTVKDRAGNVQVFERMVGE